VSGQRRHEAPELGDAVVRMLRGLVTRAAEGDWEAIEQLRRIDQLAPAALKLGAQLAHDHAGYSYGQLGEVMGVSRQGARQYVAKPSSAPVADTHQLAPGHTRRGCAVCHGDTPGDAVDLGERDRMPA
jgi:hypothetical protein